MSDNIAVELTFGHRAKNRAIWARGIIVPGYYSLLNFHDTIVKVANLQHIENAFFVYGDTCLGQVYNHPKFDSYTEARRFYDKIYLKNALIENDKNLSYILNHNFNHLFYIHLANKESKGKQGMYYRTGHTFKNFNIGA